jgi:hypothetical protein
MTPEAALGACLPPPGAPDADIVRAWDLRREIIANTKTQGEYNLAHVALRRAQLLPPLETNEHVLVAVPVIKKQHSAVTGAYA